MKYQTLLALTLFIAGCVFVAPVEEIKLAKPKPQKPDAVTVYSIKWQSDDGKVWLTAEDGVKLKAQSKDTIRYIKEMQELVCYYENTYSFCKENINEK